MAEAVERRRPARARGVGAPARASARAAARFLAELGPCRIEPRRARQRPERVGAERARGARYAGEIAQIHAGYRAALDRAGLVDRELFAWRTLAAFRENPGRAGARRRSSSTASTTSPRSSWPASRRSREHVDVDALVSVRARPRTRSTRSPSTFARLEAQGRRARRAGGRARPLRAGIARRAAPARARVCSTRRATAVAAGTAVRAPLRRRRARRGRARGRLGPRPARGGNAGRRHRRRVPQPRALRVARRPGLRGIRHPVLARPPRAARPHSRSGRGLLALLRCALPELGGTTDDLLTYLRSPGRLDVPGLADRLEAKARQEGIRDADAARSLWEEEHEKLPLTEIDALARRGRRPGEAARGAGAPASSGCSRGRTCAARTSSAATRRTCRARSRRRATPSRSCARSGAPLPAGVSSTTRFTS